MFSRRPLLGMYSSTQKHASAVAGLEKVVEVVLAAVNWLSSIDDVSQYIGDELVLIHLTMVDDCLRFVEIV